MANTDALYNAAYIGALSGISSRWLSSEAEAIYPAAKAACVAYATAIDELLGSVADVSQADMNLLQQISSSFWEERMPVSTETADYAIEVAPLADLFMAARDELIPDGVGVIGSDNVINESTVPGDSLTEALYNLSGDHPPAMCVSLFGGPGLFCMMEDQITASNNELPGLIWTPPFEVQQFTIGPDQHIYSTGGGFIRRYQRRLSSGPINRIAVATTSLTGWPAFFRQSPRSGINPATLWQMGSTGGRRIAGATALTNPDWTASDVFTLATVIHGVDSAFDIDGNLWATNTGLTRINATQAPGAIVADVRFTGSNWPSSSQGVAVAPNGDVWYSNYAVGGGTLRKVTAANVAASVGAGPLNIVPDIIISSASLLGAEMMIFDYAGNLWVVSYDNTSILMFAAADLLTSGVKVPTIILGGGGAFGDGNLTGPVSIRFFEGFGPAR